MSCRCYRSLTLPRGVMGWSEVCDCGISWSYSLTFFCIIELLNLIRISNKMLGNPRTFSLLPNYCNPLPHRDAFKCLCKQSRLRSGSFYKSCLIRVYSGCLLKYDISDITVVDLTSNFFLCTCTNMKVYFIIIHSGWSLA